MAEAPFVWGEGGSQLTPEQIASRRKMADAMIANGADFSPVQHWTQGMARVAQALVGNMYGRDADAAATANRIAENELFSRALGGAASAQQANTPAAQTAPVVPPSPAVAPPATVPTSPQPSGPAPNPFRFDRAPVASTDKVVGDAEGIARGLYDDPAKKVANAMAQQPAPASPGVRTVATAMNPAIVQLATSPYVSDRARQFGLALLSSAMKPRDTWEDIRGTDGSLYQRNRTTGELKSIEKSDVLPELAVSQKERIARAGKQEINIGGGSDKQVFDAMDASANAARAAATGLNGLREAKSALQAGIYSGFAADQQLAFQKAAAALGMANPEKIANTETFRAAIAPQVAAMIKSTVGTANISNSDREFAEKAAGGNITLDAKSIGRLLDIMERAGTGIVDAHTKRLDRVYPDPDKFARERAIFGVDMPAAAPSQAPAQRATRSGVQWSVQ